jgi:hypothetical protein
MSKFNEVIEIEVRKASPARSPPIAKKLLKKMQAPLSMNDIEQKLKKAN